MKTINRLVVWALVAAAPAGVALRAGNEDRARTTGHVLLLENERTIVGDIERTGQQYQVHRAIGATTLPAAGVLALCDNLEEAYDLLRTRANLNDPDERIRLARWCQLHGLREQAVAEIGAAVELRPDSPECQRMRQSILRSVATAATPTVPVRPGADSALPPLPFEIDAECLGQFITRVQPIIMNTCATCHMAGKGGAFKLMRATEGGVVNRRATQQNLVAVLGQVNKDRWEASPFLNRSVSLHGDAVKSPIKNRQTPAFRSLEEWVRLTVRPGGEAEHPPVMTAAASGSNRTQVEQAVVKPMTGEPVSVSRPVFHESKPAAAEGPPKPMDPFDPVQFNQPAKGKK